MPRGEQNEGKQVCKRRPGKCLGKTEGARGVSLVPQARCRRVRRRPTTLECEEHSRRQFKGACLKLNPGKMMCRPPQWKVQEAWPVARAGGTRACASGGMSTGCAMPTPRAGVLTPSRIKLVKPVLRGLSRATVRPAETTCQSRKMPGTTKPRARGIRTTLAISGAVRWPEPVLMAGDDWREGGRAPFRGHGGVSPVPGAGTCCQPR